MTRRSPSLAVCLAFVLAALGCSSGSGPDAIGDPDGHAFSPAIGEADLRRHIEVLASDAFEGRAPGTAGGRATRAYLTDQMGRIGMRPAVDGGFEQPVTLVEITLDPDASSLRFDLGTGESPAPEYGADYVVGTRRVEERVDVEDSDLVFVGYGIVAPEYGWDDYAGLDVRGKTVVMLVNDPGYATGDPELFNGRAMTYYGRWTYKYEEAARQGAAGAIIVHDTAPASYGWNVIEGSWTGAQLDLERRDGGAGFCAFESWITLDLARALFEAAGLDLDAQSAAARVPGFRPVPLGGLTVSATLRNRIAHVTSANVAGVVEGTQAPDEYVLYVAHWDHLGHATEVDGDDVYNGAIDNATGTAAILEIGEHFAANPPARSVLIMAVTAEESGLLGSAYFAEHPFVPLRQIVGGINIDAVLASGRSRDVVVVGHGASELEDVLGAVAEAGGVAVRPDPEPEKGYFYRSDHISLAKRGVPMLYADLGMDLEDGGEARGRALSDAYREHDYHQPSDELTDAWDLGGIVQLTELLRDVGERLANSEDWPNWYDGNEFRALRDEQRGGG